MKAALFWYFVAGLISGLLLWVREYIKEADDNQPVPG
jgi:hypothetical protein